MNATTDISPAHSGPTTNSEPDRRGRLWRSRWAAIGAAVAVTLGAGGFVGFVDASSSAPSDVVAVTPVRILDTRDPNNVGLAGPFASRTPLDLQVTGVIPTATGAQQVVPAGASAILLNVTAVNVVADGFISVRPADAPGSPTTSNLNFRAGSIVPNAVTVQVPTAGADAGKIEITYDAFNVTGPTTDVLVDVVGYTMPDVQDVDPPLLFAVIDADGSVARSTPGLPIVASLLPGVPAGRYTVNFGRDVSACSYQATVGRPGVSAGPEIGFAMVANASVTPLSTVSVFVKDQNGAGAERGFHLSVIC